MQRTYLLISLSKTWAEAQHYCRSCYSDLVTVTPQNEPVLTASATDTWIGLHRIPGGWQWSDGHGSSYYKWAPSELNNSGGHEDCAAHQTNNNWNDCSCTSGLYFHCYEGKYEFRCQALPTTKKIACSVQEHITLYIVSQRSG
ncbi:UNVERIFIED_CONTAM: hypothetical protein FKN15_062277 [Acipenser sinensis]